MKSQIRGFHWNRRRASALVGVLVFTSLVLFAIISTAAYALHRRMETVRLTLHGAELAAAENALERSYALLYFAAQRRPSQIRLGNGIEGFVAEVVERGGDTGVPALNDGFQVEIIAVPLPGYTDESGTGKIVLIDQEAINDLGMELEPWRDFMMQVSGYQVIAGARARDVRTTDGESAFPFQNFITRPAVYVSKNLVQYNVPLLNYAIFYENEFELDAGQRIDVRGKVHTNSDWYLTTSSSAYYHDYITVAGNLYGGVYHYGDHSRRSWSGSRDVYIANRRIAANSSPNVKLHSTGRSYNNGWLSSALYNNRGSGAPKLNGDGTPDWDPNPNWVDESIALFNGFLKDSSHGVLPVKLPLDEQETPRLLIDPPLPAVGGMANPQDVINDSKMNVNLAYKAGLIIETKPGFATASSSNWKNYVDAYRWRNDGIDSETGLPILVREPVSIEYERDKPGSKPPVREKVLLVDRVKIFNGREEKYVTLVDFQADRMAEFLKLQREFESSGGTKPNPNAHPDRAVPTLKSPTGKSEDDGIVYFHVDQSGLSSSQQIGTRLSEMSYKILNDITTLDGRSDADKRGLAFGTNAPMYTNGHVNHDPNNSNNRIPLMIAGDAINILSSAFKDSDYASGSGNGPNKGAKPTTTNAVFVSGNVPSRSGQYSGGGENFFRYIESWGGSNPHTFTGSMLNLYESQVATAPWDKDPGRGASSGYYGPPRRIWGWDTRFSDAGNAPPGIPTSYNVSVGRWQLVGAGYYQDNGGDESLAKNE